MSRKTKQFIAGTNIPLYQQQQGQGGGGSKTLRINLDDLGQGALPGIHYQKVECYSPSTGVTFVHNVGKAARRLQQQQGTSITGQTGQQAPQWLVTQIQQMNKQLGQVTKNQAQIARALSGQMSTRQQQAANSPQGAAMPFRSVQLVNA